MDVKNLIIDTDIGDDIDDALALMLAFKLDGLNLLGVTTVFRNTPLRARLAKRILHLSGHGDIPVYAGYGKPYSWTPDLEHKFVQYTPDIEEEIYRPDNFDESCPEEAVDFIIECAEKYGSSLVLLAIGPYTNIAKAYQKAPDTISKCRIVLMGGCFYEQFIEYNAAMDPEACDIIIKNLSPEFIGADVTWQAQLDDHRTAEVLGIHSDDLAGYSAELLRLWKSSCWFNPVLHDPLALYYVADSSICGMEEVWTEIELRGEHTRGLTANFDRFYKYLEHKTPDKKRVLCAKTVDAQRFIDIFLQKTFGIQ